MIEVSIKKLNRDVIDYEIDDHSALIISIISEMGGDTNGNPHIFKVTIFGESSEPIIYVEKALELPLESIHYCFNTLWGIDDYRVEIIECLNYSEAYSLANNIKGLYTRNYVESKQRR